MTIFSEVSVGTITFSNKRPFVLIAGPCVLESRQQGLEIAHALKEIAESLGVPFVFKASFDKANRSHHTSPRGVGITEGLEVLHEIRKTYHCPVLTDVHEVSQCSIAAQAVDVLQIPALLSRQTDLIAAAAKTGCALHIKKGQFMAPLDMKNTLEKAAHAGSARVLLCERGVSFGYQTLVVDMRSLPLMASLGAPVIFDATHAVQSPGALGGRSGGDRRFVEALARAALAIGVAGVFMETHPDPDKALSDGPNMVPLQYMKGLLMSLKIIDAQSKQLTYQEFSLC